MTARTILVDLRGCQFNGDRGIPAYAQSLALELSRGHPRHRWLLLRDEGQPPPGRADELAAHADAPAALHAYAQRRRADRAAITTVTRWLPQVFATRAAPIAAARMLGLAALDLLPPARRGLAELLMFGVR